MYPSPTTCARFGVDGAPVPLAGGEGVAFRVDNLVLKRTHDVAEAQWTQALLSRIEQSGFRVPEPVPITTGQWGHGEWISSAFIEGLRPVAPDWDAIADAGLRFADAAEQTRHGGREILDARAHRWAVADRFAWGEEVVELNDDASAIHEPLGAMQR